MLLVGRDGAGRRATIGDPASIRAVDLVIVYYSDFRSFVIFLFKAFFQVTNHEIFYLFGISKLVEFRWGAMKGEIERQEGELLFNSGCFTFKTLSKIENFHSVSVDPFEVSRPSAGLNTQRFP